MRILVAPDSFKESMSAAEVCRAVATGVLRVWPSAQVQACPMADGGEGTLDSVLASGSFVARHLDVQDALGRTRHARYGWDAERQIGLVEVAEACGLEHIDPADRDIWASSSFGVGQLIENCLDQGATKIFITLGGSATNDGGAGMMAALGVRFLEGDVALAPVPADLERVTSIDVSGLDPRLADVRFEVAVDVNNPLLGENGATYIFGPQKGADDPERLDRVIGRMARIATGSGPSEIDTPGAGAAGGLGWASLHFLHAAASPGVDLVAQLVGLADLLEDADLVFTGEGRADSQTLSGKTAHGVARIARASGVPVILLAGSIGKGAEVLVDHGIAALMPIMRGPASLQEALASGPENVAAAAETACRLIELGQRIS